MGIPVVWGGAMPTLISDIVLHDGCADYVVSKGIFQPPATVKEWAKFKLFDTVQPNVSQIPSRELKVVLNHYLWQSFNSNFDDSKHSNVFAVKAIAHTVQKTFSRVLLRGIPELFAGFKEFCTVVFNAKFFPHILKKYGLK